MLNLALLLISSTIAIAARKLISNNKNLLEIHAGVIWEYILKMAVNECPASPEHISIFLLNRIKSVNSLFQKRTKFSGWKEHKLKKRKLSVISL